MKFLPVMLLCVIAQTACAQKAELPKTYSCSYTAQPLSIDGLANEADWQKASWTDLFSGILGDKRPAPFLDTRVKMLWDSNYFYFYAEMEEPHIWAKLKERDAIIFHDNDFEVFIDPDGDTHNYYELEINALNTAWDLLLTRAYRNGGHAIDHWDMHGLKSAVKINGTINNPSDQDKSWALEIAIPWDVLKEASRQKAPPKEGDLWRVNFSRVEWETEVVDGKYVKKKDPDTGKSLHENNWVWSPMRAVAMHEPEFWGVVLFTTGKDEIQLSAEQEFELAAKAMLYAAHRKQLALQKSKQPYLTNLNELAIAEQKLKGKHLNLKISIHQVGYLLEVSHPLFDTSWLLDQTGRSWKRRD